MSRVLMALVPGAAVAGAPVPDAMTVRLRKELARIDTVLADGGLALGEVKGRVAAALARRTGALAVEL